MTANWLHAHISPDIGLNNLSLGYRGKVVLSGINAILPPGQVSVILGGSGGGKSTLLKAILGLLPPGLGKILIGGINLYDSDSLLMRDVRKHMGVLFQDGALLGSLPLGENIALPMREHTKLDESLIETMVKLKLSLVGLEKFIDYFPSQLSGGMRKRAGLARALSLDPRILLCDEPTSGLDPITAADLDQLILELKEAFGMTIVVVSHDLQSLFTIADHVVVLNEGGMVFQGNVDELRRNDDPFLVRFLNRRPDRGTKDVHYQL